MLTVAMMTVSTSRNLHDETQKAGFLIREIGILTKQDMRNETIGFGKNGGGWRWSQQAETGSPSSFQPQDLE